MEVRGNLWVSVDLNRHSPTPSPTVRGKVLLPEAQGPQRSMQPGRAIWRAIGWRPPPPLLLQKQQGCMGFLRFSDCSLPFPCCADAGELFSPMRGSEGEAEAKGSLICAITMGKRAECKVCIQTLTSSDSWKECPVTQAGGNKIGIQNITFLSKVQKALCCPREKFFGPAIHCKGREAANGGIHPSPSSRANRCAPRDVGISSPASISKSACFSRL
ncbi:UNVERIFIED_CONTAM: hypothetical protein K2H54_007516 [Gekko kuhli]